MHVRKGLMVAALVAATTAAAMSMSADRSMWRMVISMLARTKAAPAVSAPRLATAAASSELPARNGAAPKVVPISLTLSGDVLGLPAGRALDGVDVVVGTQHVSAVVSGAGFTATTPLMRPGDMVVVTATAGDIKYRSVLGSMARLKALAAGDGVASSADAPALHVGPFSTAFAVLERNSLGGRDASSDTEFEDTLGTFLGYDLGVVAYMLDQYASGARVLPPGYATGFDVVSDPSRLGVEIDPVTSNGHYTWPAALTMYMAARPALAPIARVDEMPARLLARSGKPKDELPMNTYAALLDRRDDGRFTYLDTTPVADSRYDGVITAGTFRLTAVTPSAQRRFETTSFSPSTPVAIDRTLNAIEWRRLYDGSRVDYWLIVYRWQDSYPDVPAQAPVQITTTDLIGSTDFSALVRTQAWSTIASQRQTLPVHCMGAAPVYTLDVCDTALHRFDAGGAGVTEDVGYKVDSRMQPQTGGYGVSFAWSTTSDGGLQVRYTDGATTLWSVDGVPGVDAVVYAATRTSGGVSRTALGTAISVRAETVPFDVARAAGTWRSGMTLAYPSTYPSDNASIVWTRNSDGTGEEANTILSSTSHIPQWWSVIGERLYERRTRAKMADGSTRWVSDCASAQAAGATQCAPWRVRYLRPLRRVGSRLYGIEEIHLQSELKPIGYSGTYSVTSTTRASFHQCDAGSCATAP
ncbi:hypothetical protein [Cognatilysobacter terrigena]|uniref:hypothetical protein n=1 Tax=Cognatilysobacter terrigena TaxID=2488749 RepID=UPI00105E33C3|nr:hypothetical protein [Lysobacter terrigena]